MQRHLRIAEIDDASMALYAEPNSFVHPCEVSPLTVPSSPGCCLLVVFSLSFFCGGRGEECVHLPGAIVNGVGALKICGVLNGKIYCV